VDKTDQPICNRSAQTELAQSGRFSRARGLNKSQPWIFETYNGRVSDGWFGPVGVRTRTELIINYYLFFIIIIIIRNQAQQQDQAQLNLTQTLVLISFKRQINSFSP
jgi:hypothetical protein